MQTFLVGGAVRDQLLGLMQNEKDWVVVGATVEYMIAQGFRQIGKDFPVFIHPETKEEYALARTERKSGMGYHGFVFQTDSYVSLEDDLYRRDLTINAMALDADNQLIDPWGGKKDIEQKVLRHVSPAFVEDPVRVLRVARFAARFHHLGFSIADETIALMRTMSENRELQTLVAERVWRELETALCEPSPFVFLTVLHEVNALAFVMPEVVPLLKDKALSKSANTAMSHIAADKGSSNQVFAVLVACIYTCTNGDKDAKIDLYQRLYKRIKAPKSYQKLASASVALQSLLSQQSNINPEILLAFFEKIGLLRQSAQFSLLREVAKYIPVALDEKARELLLDLVEKALKTLLALDLESIASQYEESHSIGKAVKIARLEALSDLLSD